MSFGYNKSIMKPKGYNMLTLEELEKLISQLDFLEEQEDFIIYHELATDPLGV